MIRGRVFNIMRYSISDGPGIRTTVFLKGCPLHCLWCHNPESQSAGLEVIFRRDRCLGCGECLKACPRGAVTPEGYDRETCLLCGRCLEACSSGAREGSGREMSTGQVMAEIEKDILFYDQSGGGVTFSGGEPLAQPGFLLSLLKACRRQEISTAVDTSGYGPWECLDRVVPEVDLFLYDLKIMDEKRHREATGVSNSDILKNLESLSRVHGNILVRFPVIPGFTDDPGNIFALGKFLQQVQVQGIELLPYHKIGIEKYPRLGMSCPVEGLESPGEDVMQRVRETLEGFHLKIIRGGNSHARKG